MAEIKVGDRVWYVAHAGHWNDSAGKEAVFEFVHHKDGPPLPRGQQHLQVKAGEALPAGERAWGTGTDAHDKLPLGRVEEVEQRPSGMPVLHLSKGHTIRATRPLRPWEAKVIRVNADGTVDLDVLHPCGHEVHRKPDREGCWEKECERLETVALAIAGFCGQAKPGSHKLFPEPLFPAEQQRVASIQAAVRTARALPVEGRFDTLLKALDDGKLLEGIDALDRDVGAALAQSLGNLRQKHPLQIPGIAHDPTGQGLHTFHLPGEAQGA